MHPNVASSNHLLNRDTFHNRVVYDVVMFGIVLQISAQLGHIPQPGCNRVPLARFIATSQRKGKAYVNPALL